MLAEICKANDISIERYRKYKDRYLTRIMILHYWRDQHLITSDEWLTLALREVFQNYKRETGCDFIPTDAEYIKGL